jgi:glutamate:Na+ symporter, ESS family
MRFSISAFSILLLAVPVLLLGEVIVRRLRWLRQVNIPGPVAGGLLVATLILVLNLTEWGSIQLDSRTTAPAWAWFVTPEMTWVQHPPVTVMLPLMVGFFTCIGLNASWELLRPGALLVLKLLAVSILLAIVQNFVGLGVAKLLGVSPLLGLVCGALTLTGGPGTAVSFAPEFEKLGLAGAINFALAAATFGIVMGGLLGGPVGAWLIRRRHLRAGSDSGPIRAVVSTSAPSGFVHDLRSLVTSGRMALVTVLIVVGCMKAGAWLTYFMQKAHLFFALQIGSMIVGVILRNVHDALGWRWIRTATVEAFSNLLLGLFIAAAMMTINLRDLAATGGPMLVILAVQVVVAVAFVILITFPVMNRDYESAVTSAGHIGFGLGITANAVANMQSLVDRFGPAPRAFLAVPIVGGFLIDFANGLLITVFLQWFG